jgi:2-polyprenyl-6-methoxyphenol hydroxylase-like FAD-dependent oxidoreductase
MLGAVADIIVLGGGVCGLGAGMLLARDGHDVTLLECDPAPVPQSPDEAWENWERSGVTQFRQAHYLHARATEVIGRELPDIREALLAADGATVDYLRKLAPMLPNYSERPGDERLATLTARRTTVEQIFGTAADAEPRVDVRRGVSVAGLMTGAGSNGVPHVSGVRTEDGEELHADLVVDAMGRRSTLPRWLGEIGCAPVHEEAEDSGFIYYTRFFESSNGDVPEAFGPLLLPIGSFSVLTLPSDRNTWSVTLFVASGDQPLKVLRHEEAWTALVRSCPLQAHWLEGEPLTGIEAMGGVIDRYRRFVADGRPVATGIAAVGDSWACTNPSLGRGISLGLAHAALLRDVVRAELDDPLGFAEAWDEATERELAPWYRDTVAIDRARLAEIDAVRKGLDPPGPADFKDGLGAALFQVMPLDADLFRAGLEITGCLTLPEEVFARPGLVDRVVELAEANPAQPPPGPTRDDLLRLLAEPAGA